MTAPDETEVPLAKMAVPLGEMVRERARHAPEAPAYLGDGQTLTWSGYDRAADALAGRLAGLGLVPGDRVGVYLPDGPQVHVAYTACERAGLVIAGIPERASDRELDHLLRKTGAALLLCRPEHRGRTGTELAAGLRARGVPLSRHAEITADGTLTPYAWPGRPSGERAARLPGERPAPVPHQSADVAGRQLGPGELWLLNSTSGTTGLPKCVEQAQRTWIYLAWQAVRSAALGPQDVLMSVVPSPFGYGLWTAHVLPALLGVPCVLSERFTAEQTLRAAAEHRVTVLACVTTQLRMMLASPTLAEADLSALRVLYTGGERLPPDAGRDWERRTGSAVLQFYGSNELGPFSCTSLDDEEELRLTTVGRVVPGTDYRIYDERGRDITETGGPGQPGGRGPGVFGGYWDDDDANAQLFHQDGYQLLPDIVTLDQAGYVRIAGRKADLIIRGGKNISAASVEAEVAAHPDVGLVAVLPMPDPLFGERICAIVSRREQGVTPTLAGLLDFLAKRGVGKEYFPEHLIVLDDLPQSAGGKIAKSELKGRLPDLLAASRVSRLSGQ